MSDLDDLIRSLPRGEWSPQLVPELIIGDFPLGGYIDISSNIPAELIAFYAANYNGGITKAYIKFTTDNNFYYYLVIFRSVPAGTDAGFGVGFVKTDAVPSPKVYEDNVVFVTPPTLPNIQRHSGVHTPMYQTWGNPGAGATDFLSQLFMQNIQLFFQTTANGRAAGADFQIDGISQGRGNVYSENYQTLFNTPAAIGEVLVTTTANNITWLNNRAYYVEWLSNIKSAVVQNPQVIIHKDNIASLVLVGGRVTIATTGIDAPLRRASVIINVSGADITSKLALGCSPQAATIVSIDGGNNAGWNVWDIGDASKFAGWQAIV